MAHPAHIIGCFEPNNPPAICSYHFFVQNDNKALIVNVVKSDDDEALDFLAALINVNYDITDDRPEGMFPEEWINSVTRDDIFLAIQAHFGNLGDHPPSPVALIIKRHPNIGAWICRKDNYEYDGESRQHATMFPVKKGEPPHGITSALVEFTMNDADHHTLSITVPTEADDPNCYVDEFVTDIYNSVDVNDMQLWMLPAEWSDRATLENMRTAVADGRVVLADGTELTFELTGRIKNMSWELLGPVGEV